MTNTTRILGAVALLMLTTAAAADAQTGGPLALQDDDNYRLSRRLSDAEGNHVSETNSRRRLPAAIGTLIIVGVSIRFCICAYRRKWFRRFYYSSKRLFFKLCCKKVTINAIPTGTFQCDNCNEELHKCPQCELPKSCPGCQRRLVFIISENKDEERQDQMPQPETREGACEHAIKLNQRMSKKAAAFYFLLSCFQVTVSICLGTVPFAGLDQLWDFGCDVIAKKWEKYQEKDVFAYTAPRDWEKQEREYTRKIQQNIGAFKDGTGAKTAHGRSRAIVHHKGVPRPGPNEKHHRRPSFFEQMKSGVQSAYDSCQNVASAAMKSLVGGAEEDSDSDDDWGRPTGTPRVTPKQMRDRRRPSAATNSRPESSTRSSRRPRRQRIRDCVHCGPGMPCTC